MIFLRLILVLVLIVVSLHSYLIFQPPETEWLPGKILEILNNSITFEVSDWLYGSRETEIVNVTYGNIQIRNAIMGHVLIKTNNLSELQAIEYMDYNDIKYLFSVLAIIIVFCIIVREYK